MHMAFSISVVQSCGMCFSEKCLRSVIVFEGERGYRNVLGGKMRFNDFVFSKISKLWFRSKHKFANKLLDEVDSYHIASISDGSKSLNKVSVWMGYGGLHDFIESGRSQEESDIAEDLDVSLEWKKFPSIILGRSPLVELYDSLSETWRPSLCTSVSNVNSALLLREENSYTSHVYLQSEAKSDVHIDDEKPFARAGLEKQLDATSVQLNLDEAISCIPGLSKRLCRQLEDSGFHTLRKLLHHFPRTYADLQNAQIGIDDGQYLIFIGTILSSRGIRASCSFSFLEVVVGCEVANGESTSEYTSEESDSGSQRTIYLHLKKFFRGTRFTFQPFLKSLQEKHKEGDAVCVSGKVRLDSFLVGQLTWHLWPVWIGHCFCI